MRALSICALCLILASATQAQRPGVPGAQGPAPQRPLPPANAPAAQPAGPASSPGQVFGLHPMCGRDVNVVPLSDGAVDFRNLRAPLLAMSCFSWSVMANDASSSPCTEADLAGARPVIDIAPSPTKAGMTVDLGLIFQGSLYSTVFSFDEERDFTFRVLFSGFAKCAATFRYTMFAEFAPKAHAASVPVVVGSSPAIMYQKEPYTLVFRSSTEFSDTELADMKLALVTKSRSCDRDAQAIWDASNSVPPAKVNNTHFSWVAFAANAGQFDVCIQTAPGQHWRPTAIVEAYGGNPSYFDLALIAGQEPDQLPPRNGRPGDDARPTVDDNRGGPNRNSPRGATYDVRFFGIGLDASRDQLRVVDVAENTCTADAGNAPQVEVGSLQQVSGSSTTARVTIAVTGVYLMCYFNAQTGAWTAVPNFDSMSRTAIANTSALNKIDDPLALTLTVCPSAPVIPGNLGISRSPTIVRITYKGTLAATFLQSIADLVCVPLTSLALLDTRATGDTTYAYVSIHCPEGLCNSQERLAALIANFDKLDGATHADTDTRELGLMVDPTKSHDQEDDGKTINRRAIIGIAIGAGIVVIVLSAVIAFLVVRHRRHQAELQAAANGADDAAVEATVVNVRGGPYGLNDDIHLGCPIDEDDGQMMPVVVYHKESAPLPPSREHEDRPDYRAEETASLDVVQPSKTV